MNPIIIVSFLIPASIAFILITLLIRERENLLPGNRNRNGSRPIRPEEGDRNRLFPDKEHRNKDYMDLSGGTMGI